MIGTPPSTVELKQVLWCCLRSHLGEFIELTNTHPRTLDDILLKGGRIVITEIDNRTIQRQLTTQVASSPALQFAAYHQNEAIAGQLMEEVDSIVKLKCCCLRMNGQRLDHVQRRQWMPVRFVDQVALYVSACVFEFFLQACISCYRED
jgi:hypothetical protein